MNINCLTNCIITYDKRYYNTNYNTNLHLNLRNADTVIDLISVSADPKLFLAPIAVLLLYTIQFRWNDGSLNIRCRRIYSCLNMNDFFSIGRCWGN